MALEKVIITLEEFAELSNSIQKCVRHDWPKYNIILDGYLYCCNSTNENECPFSVITYRNRPLCSRYKKELEVIEK